MEIHFKCNRKLELAVWRKIVWGGWEIRMGCCLFCAVLLISGAFSTGSTWLWVGTGVILTIIVFILMYVLRLARDVVYRDGDPIHLRTDEEGISMKVKDESMSVGWNGVHGLNRFGNFWLFNCDNGGIATQLIPDEAVDEKTLAAWNEKIVGASSP